MQAMKHNLKDKGVTDGEDSLLAVGPFRELYTVARY